MKKEIVNICWQLVQQQDRQVLLIETLCEEIEVYVIEGFKCKSRDFFQNEVIGAQRVTDLLEGIELFPTSNNKLSTESKINSRPKMDFTFGHDNFLLLRSIQKNEY